MCRPIIAFATLIQMDIDKVRDLILLPNPQWIGRTRHTNKQTKNESTETRTRAGYAHIWIQTVGIFTKKKLLEIVIDRHRTQLVCLIGLIL